MSRLADLRRFYELMGELARRSGGPRRLSACSGKMGWPARGLYFFQETGEVRSESGVGPRIVRVGTHALKPAASTTLWNRLSQHRGSSASGGGNHRGSIFRLLVGTALIESEGFASPTWGVGSSAGPETRVAERRLECRVSEVVGRMPFLWLGIADEPGPNSIRGYLERNSIALLSNYSRSVIDAPSAGWLGHSCARPLVRASGLWNQNHVNEKHDLAFLDVLETAILAIGDE